MISQNRYKVVQKLEIIRMIFSIFKEYQNICRDAQKTLKMEKKEDYDVVYGYITYS